MLRLMTRRTDEEVLDVIIGSTETEVRVGSLKGDVGRLRKLSNYGQARENER